MCIIIDANVAHQFSNGSEAAAFVVDWLSGGGKTVIGGKQKAELFKTNIKPLLVEWVRSGIARSCDDAEIDKQIAKFANDGKCKSNDVHIISLAKVSGVRLLYTCDGALIADFKNLQILSPKGRIYKSKKQRSLLKRCPKCKK